MLAVLSLYSSENSLYLEAAMNPTFCRTKDSPDLYLDFHEARGIENERKGIRQLVMRRIFKELMMYRSRSGRGFECGESDLKCTSGLFAPLRILWSAVLGQSQPLQSFR